MNEREQHQSTFGQFMAEMKRRHVVRFALGYAAVAFVLLQLGEIVFDAFGLGEIGLRVLVVAVALLFPPAVMLAWAFDITAEGIKRTEDLPGERALGRSAMVPRLAFLAVTVLTLGGVGAWIAFGGLVELVSSPGESAQSEGGTAADAPLALVEYDPAEPIRSIAVLPLDNYSADGGQDYFSQGMLEELIAKLGSIPGLRVVSRTTVMRYAGTNTPIPQVGRDLNVDAVIEGSVRREGDTVRITVQLIHAASDTHVWTQQYDRSLGNVLALQSEVALDIAEQLSAEVSAEESTLLARSASMDVDPEAQDLYLRGRFEAEKGTPDGYEAAMEHFELAIEHDSTFAPALVGLAGTRFLRGLTMTEVPEEEMALAAEEAAKALEMDSLSAEAQEVFTLIRGSYPGLYGDTESGRDANIAVEVTPGAPAVPGVPEVNRVVLFDAEGVSTAWSSSMSELGRKIEEYVQMHRISGERERLAQTAFAARQLMSAGQFGRATDLLRPVVEEDPDSPGAWEMLVRSLVSAGDAPGAVEVAMSWAEAATRGAPTRGSAAELARAVGENGTDGYWLWQQNRLDARRAAGETVSPTEYATALMALGEVDQAFGALEDALAQRDPGLAALRSDPVWDPVRPDQRFIDIVRRSRASRRVSPMDRRPPPRSDGIR